MRFYSSFPRDIHAGPLNPLITEDRDLKDWCRAGGIEIRIMLARQGKVYTSRVGDGASIITLESVASAQGIIKMSNRASLIGSPVERNNATKAPIGVTAIALSVRNIVDTVSDILIVTVEAIREVNIESLLRAIAPGLVIGQAGVADIHHCRIACFGVRITPVLAAETAFGVLVHLAVDAVETVGSIEPLEVGYSPIGDGTTVRRCDGTWVECGGERGAGQGQETCQKRSRSHCLGI